jgi:two-component system KDP operon response regulator KdpE
MAITSRLILIVDDEKPLRRLVHTSLTSEGYRVLEAETSQQAVELAAQQSPDLVILDLGLPDRDGQTVLRELREWLRAPIVILSARDQEKQKIMALDAGADDYLTKPFSTGELLARVRVALRNADKNSGTSNNSTFAVGDLCVDLGRRRVTVDGSEVHLTPIEYRLLATMVRHAGRVLTHKFLLDEVWGPNHPRENHYLRVFMASLRRKIEKDSAQPTYLLTEQGVGYRLVDE